MYVHLITPTRSKIWPRPSRRHHPNFERLDSKTVIPRHQCHPHLVCFLLGQCSVWCPPISPSLVLITDCKFFTLLPFLRVNTWAQVPCPSRLLFTISWRLSSQASVICLHLSSRSLFCVSNAQLTFLLSCKHSRQESWGGAPCIGPYLLSSWSHHQEKQFWSPLYPHHLWHITHAPSLLL